MKKTAKKLQKKLVNFIKKQLIKKKKSIVNLIKESPVKNISLLILSLILITIVIMLYANSVGLSIIFGYVIFSLISIEKAIKNPLRVFIWFFLYLFLVELRNLAFVMTNTELQRGAFLSSLIIFFTMLLIYFILLKLK